MSFRTELLLRSLGGGMVLGGWWMLGHQGGWRGELGKIVLCLSGYIFVHNPFSRGTTPHRTKAFLHYLVAGSVMALGIYLLSAHQVLWSSSALHLMGVLMLIVGAELLTFTPVLPK
ncbi:MAG: hypothetical protein ACK4OO_03165 [bacterium]